MPNESAASSDQPSTAPNLRWGRIAIIAAGTTTALVALLGGVAVATLCSPNAYVTQSSPPPVANWTDTSALWVPSGGSPGCSPNDQAFDGASTTIIVNSAIPNPINGLTMACSSCTIDIQPGGQLTLAGFGSIGSGATLKVSGGTLTIASGGTLNFMSGSQFQFTSGLVDVQAGGQLTVNGATPIASGATLQVSGGTLHIPSPASLSFQNGSFLNLSDATVDGGGTINNAGTVQTTAGTLTTVNAVLNNNPPTGSVNAAVGTLSLRGGGTGDAPFNLNGGTLDFPSVSYLMTTGGVVSGPGTLSVTGATLTIGGVTSPGGLLLTAGTITGNGFLSVGNTLMWRGGTLTGSGGTELAGSGIGTLDGVFGSMVLDGRSFKNYGYIHYTATANPLQLSNGANFSTYGTFEIDDDGSITNSGSGSSFNVFPNGLLWKAFGSGTSTIYPQSTNSGASVFASSGTLEFAGDNSNSGSFIAFAPGTMKFSAASSIFDASSFIGGDGTTKFSAGIAQISGGYDVGGTTNICGATVDISSGQTHDFLFTSGTLTVSTDFTMTNTGTWSGGTMNGTGEFFDVASGATLTIDAATGFPTIDSFFFANDGTVNYTATPSSGNYLKVINGSFVDNTGLFDIQTDVQIAAGGVVIGFGTNPTASAAAATPSRLRAVRSGRNLSAAAEKRLHLRVKGLCGCPNEFNNSGTLQKSLGTGTTDFGPALDNSADVKALSGTISFLDPYTQTAGSTTLGAGNLKVSSPLALNGGTLDGAGTITGSVANNGGDVAPGTASTTGVINLTGNYTQGSGGTLTIKLASTGFDQLTAGGSATLDGTFTATLLNSYAPPNGTTWSVHTFASKSGDFATKNLPTYGVGGSIQSSYSLTSFDLTAVVVQADVSITKSGPTGVASGQNIVYTIIVKNNGPSQAVGVVVSDPTPTNTTFVSNSGGCTTAYPCNLGTLNSGQSVTITSTYSTAANFSGTIPNTATVSTSTPDPDNSNNSANTSTNVGPQADLSISKTGPPTTNTGQSVVYTIMVHNAGLSSATNTVVADPTPVGLAFQSNTGACSGPFPCNLGTLASGATVTITSTYTVPGNYASATIVNTASVSSSVSDPNMSDNSSTATTNVAQQADVSITKTGPPSTSQGQNIVYSLVVSNSGPSGASGVTVNDATPTGLTFVSNSGACSTAFPCNLGVLNASQSVTITSTFSVPANYPNASISNTATVSSAANDSNSGNNSSTVVTPVVAQADLSITKSGPPSFTPGQNITYTVAVTNAGPLPATNTFVADPTPAGLTFVSNSGACAGPYPCALGTLASGQSVTITSTYNVPANYSGGSITNTATVSSSSADTNQGNNSAVATTPLGNGSTDLAITKSGPADVNPNTVVDFNIYLFNNGPSSGTGVVINDPTPPGLAFISNSGGCSTPFPCNIGTVLPGKLVTITARYVVQAAVGSTITNTATVTSSGIDTNANNDSSSATTHVIAGFTCPSQAPLLLTPIANSTVTSPVSFSWTAVSGATSYTVTITGNGTSVAVASNTTSTTVVLPGGTYTWIVQAGNPNCQPVTSASSTFKVCAAPDAPLASVVALSTTGQTYTVQWTAGDGVTTYELQESSDSSFSNPTVSSVAGTSKSFTKSAQTPTAFFYRVRATGGCSPTIGPFSLTVSVVVIPVPPPNSGGVNIPVQNGSTTPVTFPLFVPGQPGGTTSFVATVDKPWLAVTPTAGIVPPEGITLTISADPSSLSNGTWTGTIIVVYGAASVSGKTRIEAATPVTSIPVSISLVTPVSPGTTTTPAASAMVIPSVGHLAGASSDWRSDIRLANVTSLPQRYQLSFNAGGATSASLKQTTISVDAGGTMALDDIVRTWYGVGALGDSSNGVLTIQPVDASGKVPANDVAIAKATVVSSRTYNASTTSTIAGTLGQFIPATPFSSFIGRSIGGALPTILTLQQIAQNNAYRTNLGLVEVTGKSATAQVSVFDAGGSKVFAVSVTLNGGEQRQFNSFLQQNNISLSNGHIEVLVTGGDGKITTYASIVDSVSNDPFLVSGVPLGGLGASRFVVPGVADLNGSASWRSDLRIFNGGAAPQNTTLTFYPTGNPTANVSKVVTVNPGEVKGLDSILQSIFGLTNVGGALHVTTATDSPLVVTARTYDQTPNGTLGQFVPAVTPNDAVGTNDRALQILQAEESSRFRTNLGIAEVTGKAVTAEVSIILPDSKVSPKAQIQLAPFEFRQYPIFNSLGINGATYNARISVRVIDGTGKITAYGSVIDMITQDPTYIPAQ